MWIIAKFNVISILRWLSPLTVYLYGGVLHSTALYTLLPPRSLAQLSARVTRRCCTVGASPRWTHQLYTSSDTAAVPA